MKIRVKGLTVSTKGSDPPRDVADAQTQLGGLR